MIHFRTIHVLLRSLFIIGILTGSFLFSTPDELRSQCSGWEIKSPLSAPGRARAVGFSIGNKGYVGTGYDGNTSYKDFWEYDPKTDTWTQKADFGGSPRSDATGFAISGKGYIGTGHDGDYKRDLWEYDTSSNTWTQKSDLPGPTRRSAVGFSIGNKGYIGTGYNGTKKNDFWEYDPSTDNWSQLSKVPGPERSEGVGFSIGDKGYVGTGTDNAPDKLKDFYQYDPAEDQWTQKADFKGLPRNFAVGFSIQNKGYIGLGHDSNFDNRQDLWKYDPLTDSWTQVAYFPGSKRNTASGIEISGKGYVGLGFDGNNRDDWYEYTPPVDQEICMVTVDSTGSNNVVVWEKNNAPLIDSFRVYREIPGQGFTYIGSVHNDSLSQYTDTDSGVNPQTQSFRYKIAAVDTCGKEGPKSLPHKTLHLSASPGLEQDIELSWNKYEGFSVSFYRIWRDTIGQGNYSLIDSVPSTSPPFSYTDQNAPTGNLDYLIQIVHPDGCTATRAKDYNSSISNPGSVNNTGILTTSPAYKGKLYPNPTKGKLWLEPGTMKVRSIEIFNTLGKKIDKFRNINQQKKFSVDLRGNKPGIYLIRIIGESTITQRSILIQNDRDR